VTDARFLQAWPPHRDPAWRRQPTTQRRHAIGEFCSAATRVEREVTQHAYSTIGLRAEGDILLWRMAEAPDQLEATAAQLLSAGIGQWLSPAVSLLGMTRTSQYVKKPTPQEQSLGTGERSQYLIVYPFTKTTDWYLSPAEERQKVMNQHMKIGHKYPQVRQLLAYSFGLDDQDFVVAYETDDLPGFSDLVRDLRGSESRRATVRDTPILLGIHRPLGEILSLLAGSPDR
jgi:chlorite dismutase